jgi:hypothetical protein
MWPKEMAHEKRKEWWRERKPAHYWSFGFPRMSLVETRFFALGRVRFDV